MNQYEQQFIGGSTFTEFLAKQWRWDLEGWSVSSQIPKGCKHRITTGWNLGNNSRFKKALLRPRIWPFHRTEKNIDVFCRLSLGSKQKKEWYYRYRAAALEALKPLASDYSMAASAKFSEDGLISRHRYFSELKRSRIVFSPFGWGETCWRDFEAVCYDCLLIKPMMEHIDTKPNIFLEEKTYVPVRWDFADLEEKCCYYLKHPDEAARIVDNARRAYEAYFEQEEFVKTIKQAVTG